MNTITNGTKVVLMKEYANLTKLGRVYEVGNITDTHIIIRNAQTKVAVAAIDINFFIEYFEVKKDHMGYTDWAGIVSPVNGEFIGSYKTNGRKVIVKIGSYKATASCCKGDKFNLSFGIQLAYQRCILKSTTAHAAELRKSLAVIDKDVLIIHSNIDKILKMAEERSKANNKTSKNVLSASTTTR